MTAQSRQGTPTGSARREPVMGRRYGDLCMRLHRRVQGTS
jgi:hypothetical protein